MPIDALHNCVIFQSWSVVTYLQNIHLIKVIILVLTLVSAGPAEYNHGGGKQNCKNNMLIVALLLLRKRSEHLKLCNMNQSRCSL